MPDEFWNKQADRYYACISDSERRLVRQAKAEAAGKRCSRCGGPLRPVFTWNAVRPYYLMCAADCAED